MLDFLSNMLKLVREDELKLYNALKGLITINYKLLTKCTQNQYKMITNFWLFARKI